MAAPGDFRLDGKRALVTGAAKGIGKAIAITMAEAGAKVIAADVDQDGLESLVAETNMAIASEQLDQGDPESIASLFSRIGASGERLDVLVNCAGIYPMAEFETVEVEFLDRMFDINLRGVFLCTREAVKLMKDGKGGAIVNISSVGAERTCIYDTVQYGVTKAGVNGLTKLAALEYAEFGIRINAIMPGGIASSRGLEQRDATGGRGPMLQPGRLPLTGTLGEPSDIANAVVFFSSNASRYVTGQILAVDGGFLIS